MDENACVQPMTDSRCRASGNSSASQATAATNSTQTPMNVRHRRTSSIRRDVAKPAAHAEKRVEQDAPDEHAAPAQAVGQVPAEQAEHAAGDAGT